MKLLKILAALLATSIVSSNSYAYVEANVFYVSDTLGAETNASTTKMFLDFSVGFAIDKKQKYLAGWNYSMHSTSDGAATTATYSSTQMGPRFIFVLDKENAWSLGVGYYLVTNATYNSGSGTSEKWKGTALKFDIGYNFAIASTSYAGIRLNYSSASYNERLQNETTYSTVGYTKTAMYPSLYYIWVF
jgi:hypothetical protein